MIDKEKDEKILSIIVKEDGTFNSSRIKSSYMKNNYPDLYEYANQRFSELIIDETIRELVVRLKDGLNEPPKCPVCGKNVKFDGRKYPLFCSKECQKSKEGIKILTDKIEKTNLIKYGTKCTLENSDIREKARRTCMERYGVDAAIKNKGIAEKVYKKLNERTV